MILQKKKKPAVLIILDGWGVSRQNNHKEGNPIELAKLPVMKRISKRYPYTTLKASGTAVGLLPGQDGNSEAGHINIGAGRIVEQDVLKISKSISQGTFFKNAAFEQAVSHAQRPTAHLHVMGLLSDEHSGHAHPAHLKALLELVRTYKVKNVFIHLFTDGRDTPPFAALGFVRSLSSYLLPHEKIATVIGRLYAMDRKKDWARTKIAYDALVTGKGMYALSAEDALKEAYRRGESDEFIPPYIIHDGKKMLTRISDGDSVIFFNLRSDRARQLTKPFVQKHFGKQNPGSFRRKKVLNDLLFVAMTDFGPDLENVLTAFPSEDLKDTLPMVFDEWRQLYIAESEKFAHITYFFNGGYDHPVASEDRVRVPSPNVLSYDQRPEMAAREITRKVVAAIRAARYDFIGLNFANADMVGHTGNLKASIRAVEILDECIGVILKEVVKKDGCVFITADHGNVEEIIDVNTGGVDTEHSSNPVPFITVTPRASGSRKKMRHGVLGDVAPTILDVLGIKKPAAMKGKSLFR